MPNKGRTRQPLEDKIAEAAQIFATEIITLVGAMTLDDIRDWSKDPRAAKNRSDGAATPQRAESAERKRSWPVCDLPGCKNPYFPASGMKRMCYEHFIQAGGKHPSQRK